MKSQKSFIILKFFSAFTAIILCLKVLFSCTKDEIAFPLVTTGLVTDISSIGATFNGRISNYSEHPGNVYGFVWAPSSGISFDDMSKYYSDNINGDGNFSIIVNSSLKNEKEYFVRAFSEIKGKVYIGNPVSFISLGAMAPEIDSISPGSAFWNEIITIYGSHFSQRVEETEVFLNDFKAQVLEAFTDSIRIVIPAELDHSPATIKVSCSENISTLINGFSITPPIINSVTPREGNYLQPITISGKNFINNIAFYNPFTQKKKWHKTRFIFHDQVLDPTYINDTLVSVVIPATLLGSTSPLIANNDGSASLNKPDYIHHHTEATYCYPETIDIGDTITLKGRFYSGVTPSVKVMLNGVVTNLISKSDSLLLFRFNRLYTINSNAVRVYIGSHLLNTGFTLNLFEPSFESVLPGAGVYKDTITINGDHFNTSIGTDVNTIYVGSKKAAITYLTKDKIKFLVPDLLPGIYPVHLKFDTYDHKIGDIEILPMKILSVSQDTLRPGNKIYVTGENLPTNITTLVFKVGGRTFYPPAQDNTSDEFYINVPYFLPHGEYYMSISTGSQTDSVRIFSVCPFEFRNTSLLYNFIYPLNSFVLGDNIYIFRGKTTARYSGVFQSGITGLFWGLRTTIPGYAVNHSTSFVIDTTAYAGLGYVTYSSEPVNRIYKTYNNLQYWEQIAPFPGGGRRLATAFSIDGLGYVGSGFDSLSNPKKDLWEYNPLGNTWNRMADMPEYEAVMSFAYGAKAWVIFSSGGFYVWNPDNDQWTMLNTLPQIPSNTLLSSINFIIDDEIYIGLNTDDILQIYKYDNINDTWISKSRIPKGNIIYYNCVNGKGFFGSSGYDMFIYDPSKDF